jgi:ATP diphosphatase
MNEDADARAGRALARLLSIMRRLRAPDGCPWDREQDFQSIAPYTIEEAYEVAEAISQATASGRPGDLQGELGDLLFQVVFHAQMGSERRWFDFASIADSIADKLTDRHPHVFAGADRGSSAELNRAWEGHKARERATRADASAEPASELADVPLALPALSRAAKLGKRAGRVGFDWPDARGVRDKIEEELREIDALEQEPADGRHARRVEELGDLLFAVANWARHLRADPEEALRLANAKFERRFRAMERLAAERGRRLEQLTPESWEGLWNEVKTREK